MEALPGQGLALADCRAGAVRGSLHCTQHSEQPKGRAHLPLQTSPYRTHCTREIMEEPTWKGLSKTVGLGEKGEENLLLQQR